MDPDTATTRKPFMIRHPLPWAAALLGVAVMTALGVKILGPHGEAGAGGHAEQAIRREQERHSAALKDAVVHLEALLEDKWRFQIKPADIPPDELEIELSARAAIPTEDLGILIRFGEKDPDPLNQARAALLAGRPDDAILSTDKVAEEKSATPDRIIQASAIRAAALDAKGEAKDALAARRRVVSLLDAEKSPLEWLDASVQVARMLSKLDRDAEACETLKKAIEFTDARPQIDQKSLIPPLNHYALCLIRRRLIEADVASARALQLAKDHLPPDHFLLISSLHTRAEFLSRKSPRRDALPLYLRACEIEEKKFGHDHLARAERLRLLGTFLRAIHKPQEAEIPLRRSLQIRDSHFKDARGLTIEHLLGLGAGLTDLRKFAEGETILRRAVDTSNTVHGAGHRQTVTCLTALAVHVHNEKRPNEAAMLYREAIDSWTDHQLEFQQDIVTAMSHLVLILIEQREPAEAASISSKAIELTRSQNGFYHPETARLLNHHGMILNTRGQWKEAISYFNQSLKITEKINGPTHEANISKLQNLAWSLENLGTKGEPRILRRRALLIAFDFRKRTGMAHEHQQTTVRNYRDYLLRQGDSQEEIENDIRQVAREAGFDN